MATSVRRSPVVSTRTISTSPPSNEATWSVCHRANWLPLVAARSRRPAGRAIALEIEEEAEGLGQALAARRARRLLQPDGRAMEELVDDAIRQRLDGLPLAVVETVEPGTVAVELGLADGL